MMSTNRRVYIVHGISVKRQSNALLDECRPYFAPSDMLVAVNWEQVADREFSFRWCCGDLFDDVLAVANGAVRCFVRKALSSGSCLNPVTVVAHSLGSWLAYEAFQAMHFPQVELFLTLGSPMNRLPQRWTKPPNVQRWVNVWSPIDPITYFPISCFPGGGIACADENVRVWSCHNLLNYLYKPAVQPWLRSASTTV
jgi:hypothetical protein